MTSEQSVSGHGPSGTPGNGPSGTQSRALRNARIGPSGTPPLCMPLIATDFSAVATAVTRARVFNFVTNQKLLTDHRL